MSASCFEMGKWGKREGDHHWVNGNDNGLGTEAWWR